MSGCGFVPSLGGFRVTERAENNALGLLPSRSGTVLAGWILRAAAMEGWNLIDVAGLDHHVRLEHLKIKAVLVVADRHGGQIADFGARVKPRRSPRTCQMKPRRSGV